MCAKSVSDEWWTSFVSNYSKALLHIAQENSRSHDEKMDRYAYFLDRLRSDNYRTLQQYSEDGSGQLITWLYVVTRRMSVDYHRKVYGRTKSSGEANSVRELERTSRRRLADMLVEELVPNVLPDESIREPADDLHTAETHTALVAAVGQLDTRDQLLVTLRYTDDVSVREIAKIMEFRSTFQVYRQLKSVLTKLRNKLESRGITSP
jgi:RNA polymerase sigma factor (sigma-70 family)